MRSVLVRLALFATAVFYGTFPAVAQEIHLKARDARISSEAARAARRPAANGAIHQIVQFDHPPGVEDLEALMETGYRVIATVPDNAVVVNSRDRTTRAIAGVKWIGPFESRYKISPALAGNGPIQAIVEFHPDVETGAQDEVAKAEDV